VHTERTGPLIIVGAAIVSDGRVLGCERADPPETAGRWEFPGGKVEPGEDEIDALIRECEEELGVRIAVGERIGGDVPLAHGWALLRVWLATLVAGEPQPLEHRSVRWLGVDELDSVPWLPADTPIVAELATLLRNNPNLGHNPPTGRDQQPGA
jgi:8-oxo-dGTP diphosphatase